MATGPATWAYRDRFGESFGRTYFRRYGEGVVSSVGVGTREGPATDDRDRSCRRALVEALESGVNVLDTAASYRRGRSERVVGAALDAADVDREAVLVATKGGLVPVDGDGNGDHGGDGEDGPGGPGGDGAPVDRTGDGGDRAGDGDDADGADDGTGTGTGVAADPGPSPAAVRQRVLDPGLADPGAVVGRHCIAPDFLDRRIDRSLSALGLDAVDLYYLREPERQLRAHPRETVYDRVEAAFRRLEERRAAGDLRAYGVATWDAFRVPPDDDAYLSLPAVVRRARRAADAAGAGTTGLQAVQVPFNARMAGAFTVRAHEGPDGPQSALSFAREAGLAAFVTAPLAGGRLAAPAPEGLPADVAAIVAGETPAQRAINFARSAPGVTAAVVGAGTPAHLREDLAAGRFDPMGADAFDAVFE